jgi:hypothetical protein
VQNDGHTVLLRHGADVECPRYGSSNRSSVVGIVQRFATIKLRSTRRELNDNRGVVLTSGFETSIDTRTTHTVDRGDRISYENESIGATTKNENLRDVNGMQDILTCGEACHTCQVLAHALITQEKRCRDRSQGRSCSPPELNARFGLQTRIQSLGRISGLRTILFGVVQQIHLCLT